MNENIKIILAALNAKYVHSNLAVYDLEAYFKKEREKAEEEKYSPRLTVREFTINHNLDFILQELYREKADVYAFSCYIWNIYEIITIARELKKLLKNAQIWFGGPEVSYDAKNYLMKNRFLSGIILGEGEVTFYELTRFWNRRAASKEALKDILGIAYLDESGSFLETGKRPLMDLDELPFVYRDLEGFQNKILYYETSRGCPFSCSYCLSSIDKRVRFRSFSIVKNELDFFLKNKVPQVKFVDRTFNCNREHALKIWNYLFKHDNGVTNFHFEIAADLIGEEELRLFQKMRPGLIQLEIGLQSTNPKTIQEIRRVMDIEKVRKILLEIRSYGNIHQHLDLIAGLPYEDFTSFQKSFCDAYEMKPNQLQLGFLKVLKGSFMGEQTEQYELKYREVQPFEVLSTKWLSYDDILVLKRVEEMVEVYYNSDQFEHVLPYVISFFDSPYEFYETFGNYYERRELFGIGFKREARYVVLREFFFEHLKKYRKNSDDETDDTESGNFQGENAEKLFDSLLTYDFYLRENVKNRPCWAKEEPIQKEVYQAFFKNGGNREISLLWEGYDSKMAAHTMHIEPIGKEAFLWILKSVPFLSVFSQSEMDKNEMNKGEDVIYCLFDYKNRSSLTKDAKVTFMKELL